VEIAHPLGLLGHSDADVLTHAVTDAVLGAAALGDIGTHFPDSCEKYRGANSLTLLKTAVGLVQDAGFCVGNIDATVVAQAPKLAGYLGRMRENLAAACKIPPSRVSVKATTEEGMGFTGKGEGIAAMAVCCLTENKDH
jgi:2-C-methyl-D-erythritol 2,4-cyclodiphosphate synthase